MPPRLSTFLLGFVIAARSFAEPVISGLPAPGLAPDLKGQVLIEWRRGQPWKFAQRLCGLAEQGTGE